MAETMTAIQALTIYECPACGIAHAIPDTLAAKRYQEGGDIYCPHGHPWGWHKNTAVKKLERQLQWERRLRDQAEASLRNSRQYSEQLEKSRRATKGHLTRLKNRVAHGVCPCCKRTFKQLAAHMKRMHPQYVETDE